MTAQRVMRTYESLPANWLHEGVDRLSDDLHADLRTAHLGRVPVHARLPCGTLRRHRGHRAFLAQVGLVGEVALRDLLHDVHGVLRDAVLHVARDSEDEQHKEVNAK